MFTKQDPHRHDFTKLGFTQEKGTAPGGNFVDRIILTRTCACGKSQAFESGDKDTMRRLYAKLKKSEGNSEDENTERPRPVQASEAGVLGEGTGKGTQATREA